MRGEVALVVEQLDKQLWQGVGTVLIASGLSFPVKSIHTKFPTAGLFLFVMVSSLGVIGVYQIVRGSRQD